MRVRRYSPSRSALIAGAASVISLILVACGSSGEIEPADSPDGLVAAFKAAGMSVDGPNENDLLSSSYFSIPGVQIVASGETVFIYHFEDPAEMAAQRALVSPDGYGIGPKFIQWITAPSYYQNGNMIVIYDGDQQLVMDTLAAAMGEPFVDGSAT